MPEEMARRLRAEYPDDVTMRGSHETIYRYLYVMPRGTLTRELLRGLGSRRWYWQRRGATSTRCQLVEPRLIDHRPQEVAARAIPGHWEGDRLLGAARCPAAVGTLVEWTTRFTVLAPVPQRHDAGAVCAAVARRAAPDPPARSSTSRRSSTPGPGRSCTGRRRSAGYRFTRCCARCLNAARASLVETGRGIG